MEGAVSLQHSINLFQAEIERLANQNKRLEAENREFSEEKQTLLSRFSHLSNATQKAQADIERLQTEKREIEKSFDSLMSVKLKRLEESLQTVTRERDALRQELELQKEESEKLIADVEGLERTNEETLIELRGLRTERDALVKEKNERERKLDSMEEDASLIISSLLVSNTDLVERIERKPKPEEKKEPVGVFSVLKIALEKMRSLVERKR